MWGGLSGKKSPEAPVFGFGGPDCVSDPILLWELHCTENKEREEEKRGNKSPPTPGTDHRASVRWSNVVSMTGFSLLSCFSDALFRGRENVTKTFFSASLPLSHSLFKNERSLSGKERKR